MPINKEELKNKIIYRSMYRGSKEMDILISKFVKTYIKNLNKDELKMLDVLINIDDENLYKLNNNIKTTIMIPDNRITKLFKKFKI